jgi:hypothetical protein
VRVEDAGDEDELWVRGRRGGVGLRAETFETVDGGRGVEVGEEGEGVAPTFTHAAATMTRRARRRRAPRPSSSRRQQVLLLIPPVPLLLLPRLNLTHLLINPPRSSIPRLHLLQLSIHLPADPHSVSPQNPRDGGAENDASHAAAPVFFAGFDAPEEEGEGVGEGEGE